MIDKTIYETLPEGWKVIDGATNHPRGMHWINNGKSLFDKEYKQALCRNLPEMNESR